MSLIETELLATLEKFGADFMPDVEDLIFISDPEIGGPLYRDALNNSPRKIQSLELTYKSERVTGLFDSEGDKLSETEITRKFRLRAELIRFDDGYDLAFLQFIPCAKHPNPVIGFVEDRSREYRCWIVLKKKMDFFKAAAIAAAGPSLYWVISQMKGGKI